MPETAKVLFFGVVFLLWMPRMGWSAAVPFVATLVPFLLALYLLVSHGGSHEEQKWALGTAAAILGYWLKPVGR